MQNEPSNSEEVQNETSNSEEVQNMPSNSEEVQNMPSDLVEVQSKPSNSEEVQNMPSNSEEVQNMPSNSEEVQNEPSNSEEVQNMPSDLVEVQSKPSNSEEVQNEPSDFIEILTESPDRESFSRFSQIQENSVILKSIPSAVAVSTESITPSIPGIIGPYNSSTLEENKGMDQAVNTEVLLRNHSGVSVGRMETSGNEAKLSEENTINTEMAGATLQENVESSHSYVYIPESNRESNELGQETPKIEQQDEDKPGQDKPDENKRNENKPDENKPDENKPDENRPGQDKREEQMGATNGNLEEKEIVEEVHVSSDPSSQMNVSKIWIHRNSSVPEEPNPIKPPLMRPSLRRPPKHTMALRNTFPNSGAAAIPQNNTANRSTMRSASISQESTANPTIGISPHDETPNPHNETPNPHNETPITHSETPIIHSETPNPIHTPIIHSETPNPLNKTPIISTGMDPPTILDPPALRTHESKTPDLGFYPVSDSESSDFPPPPSIPSLADEGLSPPALAVQTPEDAESSSKVLTDPSISGHEVNDLSLGKTDFVDSQATKASSVFVMSPFQSDFSDESPRSPLQIQKIPEIEPQLLPQIDLSEGQSPQSSAVQTPQQAPQQVTEAQSQSTPQQSSTVQTQPLPQQSPESQTQPIPQQVTEAKPLQRSDPLITAPPLPGMNPAANESLLQDHVFTRSVVNTQINTYLSVIKSKTVGRVASPTKRSSAQSTAERAQSPT